MSESPCTVCDQEIPNDAHKISLCPECRLKLAAKFGLPLVAMSAFAGSELLTPQTIQ